MNCYTHVKQKLLSVINTLQSNGQLPETLSIDAIEKANSGHPGMPMGAAPMAYTLWSNMNHNGKNPKWDNRDRFVLSAGHGSMLLYSLLYLTGYAVSRFPMVASGAKQWRYKRADCFTRKKRGFAMTLACDPVRVPLTLRLGLG